MIRGSMSWQGLALAVSLGLALAQAPASATTPLSAVDSEEVVRMVDAVLANEDGEPAIEERFAKDFVILFIPGILGSGLQGPGGEQIWGAGLPEVSRLALTAPRAHAARTTVLANYPLGILKTDVYGDFDKQYLSVDGSSRALEFSYDWRQDLDTIAAELEERIRGPWADQLAGKRLIVIAHSMGGLVTWSWKNRYYQADGAEYDFEWHRLLLLGSPLGGSCDSLRMLLDGYSPGVETRMAPLYEKFFGDLRAAAFTFPSIFQLLPRYDEAGELGVCLKRQGVNRDPQDHFSIKVWRDLLRPFVAEERVFGFRLFGLVGEDAIWQELGLRESAFWKMVESHLETARQFRDRLDLSEGDNMRGRVRYFYSNAHNTTRSLLFSGDGSTELDRQEGDGDGRVLSASATLDRYAEGNSHSLGLTHGDLPSDKTFLRQLGDLVRSLKAQIAVRVAKQKPAVRAALVERRVLLQLAEDAWGSAGDAAATADILELNRATLASVAADRPDLVWDGTDRGMVHLVSALAAESAIEPGAERPLLELAWHGGARDDSAGTVLLAQRLAQRLEEASAFAPAARVAEAGLSTLGRAPLALGTAYQYDLNYRLGSSLEELGAQTAARDAYSSAFQLADAQASGGTPGAEEAMVWLGRHYSQGLGVERDPVAARGWYEKAAEAGSAWGKVNLARLTYISPHPQQGEESTRLAVDLFQQALASDTFQKDAGPTYLGETHWNLGQAQMTLGENPEAQFSLANHILRDAWDTGDPRAATILGRMHQQGHGLPQDTTKAADWYRQASYGGQVPAMKALAKLYDDGQLPGGQAEALNWYLAAAGRGDADAMLQIGYRFQLGLGTAKDSERAAYWYQKAVEAGSVEASQYLRQLTEPARDRPPRRQRFASVP